MRAGQLTREATRCADAERIAQALVSDQVELAELDALVRAAAVAAWAPIAVVSVITDRQMTASAARVGGRGPTPARGDHTSLVDTVCVHALTSDGPIRISNALTDDRVSRIPATACGVLGAYLGVPLILDSGSLVGVLCVYDAVPRSWTETDEHDLDTLAVEVVGELTRIAASFERIVARGSALPGT